MATKKKDRETDSSQETTSRSDGGASSAAKGTKAPQNSNRTERDSKLQAKPQPKEKKKDGPGWLEGINNARQFLREVRIEFYKISWPDRLQVVRETYSVLVLVTLITVTVLAFDWFLSSAIFGPLEHFARMHGGGVGHG
jgi:preprotein translocase SecE subunit